VKFLEEWKIGEMADWFAGNANQWNGICKGMAHR
jgi:hypothetical protein